MTGVVWWCYLKVSTEAVAGVIVVGLQDSQSVGPPGVGALAAQPGADRGATQGPGSQGHVGLLNLKNHTLHVDKLCSNSQLNLNLNLSKSCCGICPVNPHLLWSDLSETA